MLKYIIAVLIPIVGALLLLVFVVGVPRVYTPPAPELTPLHTYDDPRVSFDNPTRSIEDVHVYVVYFMPSDFNMASERNATSELAKRRPAIEDALKNLGRFHELQLQGRSRLSYSIYPKAVIGRFPGGVYEANDTPLPEGDEAFESFASVSGALSHVALEIEERVLMSGGDLFDTSFFEVNNNKRYSVLWILYEGALPAAAADVYYNRSPEAVKEFAEWYGIPESIAGGASIDAVDGGIIVPTDLFDEHSSRSDVMTVLAHEFYHTFHIPDGYLYNTLDVTGVHLATTSDIMGLRRFEAFHQSFLSREVLAFMGL